MPTLLTHAFTIAAATLPPIPNLKQQFLPPDHPLQIRLVQYGLDCQQAQLSLQGVWQVGRLLVSRHASHILIAHQYHALDGRQNRSAQRPRVCICLGAGFCSSPLVRKLISHFLAHLLTHSPLPLPLPLPAFLMRDFILDWLYPQ